jgi:hypothetical protein
MPPAQKVIYNFIGVPNIPWENISYKRLFTPEKRVLSQETDIFKRLSYLNSVA